MLKKLIPVIFLSTGILFYSCKKQDQFTLASISDYYPLQVGKFITYNVDSTVFINFGKRDTIIKYQVQDRVDAQLTDNNGKPVYRIIRYIRKNETQTWSANNTFTAAPRENSIDLIENNLRFQKLKMPVSEGFSWKGNTYLPIDPYPSYQFASAFTDDWDYTYDSVNAPLTIGAVTIDSTIKVSQADESLGQDPKNPATTYAERTYAIEKYAKGIGLVYKEFLHWEYQGGGATFKGFGIKMTMKDHN